MNCEQLCWMGGIRSSNFHSLPSSASVVRALSQCTIFKSSLSILLSLGIHFFCILLLLVIITTRSKSGSMHAVAAEEVVTECALWKIFESSKTCKISLCNELVRRSTIYQSCKLRDPPWNVAVDLFTILRKNGRFYPAYSSSCERKSSLWLMSRCKLISFVENSLTRCDANVAESLREQYEWRSEEICMRKVLDKEHSPHEPPFPFVLSLLHGSAHSS